MSTSSDVPLIQVQGLDVHTTLTQALIREGKSAQEAQLLADRNVSGLVSMEDVDATEMVSTARKEGLAVWRTDRRWYFAGLFRAFRALLMRWPVAAGESLGSELANQLMMPMRPMVPISWPTASPEGWGERPMLMGILNVTPDSFSDGGRYLQQRNAIDRGLAMVEEGADILDIGGESTRPGADVVPVDEELARVVPVIEKLAQQTQTPISVDTYKPEVAAAAIEAGAAIINDISGLQDPAMVTLAARTGVPVVLMHMQGLPHTMQQAPHYGEVVAEVVDWLRQACDHALACGMHPGQLIIDPGVGFGKTQAHNLTLMARLADFRCLGYPVLIGTSRKSVVGNVLGLPVDQRLEGTAATVASAVQERAEIIRVHDVKAMRRVIDMTYAITTAAD